MTITKIGTEVTCDEGLPHGILVLSFISEKNTILIHLSKWSEYPSHPFYARDRDILSVLNRSNFFNKSLDCNETVFRLG